MRYFRTLFIATAISATLPFAAAAHADDAKCEVYSKIGNSMVTFMLPLTMQDFINITTGKDPKLSTEMTQKLIESMDSTDYTAMSEMGMGDAELMGEAAGQIAVQLLISGQASSAREVKAAMKDSCMSVGFDAILNNQRKSRANINASLGQ